MPLICEHACLKCAQHYLLYLKNVKEIKLTSWVEAWNSSNRPTSVARYSCWVCVCQVPLSAPQDVSLATQHCSCTADTFMTTWSELKTPCSSLSLNNHPILIFPNNQWKTAHGGNVAFSSSLWNLDICCEPCENSGGVEANDGRFPLNDISTTTHHHLWENHQMFLGEATPSFKVIKDVTLRQLYCCSENVTVSHCCWFCLYLNFSISV